MSQKIVLASSSPYRKMLMEKLQLKFSTISPKIDESARDGESAHDLVMRLAIAKAHKVAPRYKTAVIIASDQVATLGGQIIGKPKNLEDAKRIIKSFSGKTIIHYTSLVVLNNKTGRMASRNEPYEVSFKSLSDELIDHYLAVEKPLDCAGAVKSEGLGVALFSRMQGRDPNTLIGLPLMSLLDCFQELDVKWY